MSDDLEQLLEAARHRAVSASEREAQRRSFAYGNVHLANPAVTREAIDRAADGLAAERAANAAVTDKLVAYTCGTGHHGPTACRPIYDHSVALNYTAACECGCSTDGGHCDEFQATEDEA